jgi:hypothetical protein
VSLFIIPHRQNNILEPKSKSSKKGIVFMIKGPKLFHMKQIFKDF